MRVMSFNLACNLPCHLRYITYRCILTVLLTMPLAMALFMPGGNFAMPLQKCHAIWIRAAYVVLHTHTLVYSVPHKRKVSHLGRISQSPPSTRASLILITLHILSLRTRFIVFNALARVILSCSLPFFFVKLNKNLYPSDRIPIFQLS